MPAQKFFADSAAEVGLNPDKVQALMDRAGRDVKEGVLPACQVAIARNGKIAAMQTFGRAVQGGIEKPATDETVFVAMSATKAITSSALWLLIQEGKVSIVGQDRQVRSRVWDQRQRADHYRASADSYRRVFRPRRARSRIGAITSGGWNVSRSGGRSILRARKFFYHIHANYWPIAEAIERITGKRLGDFVRERIAEPLGLPDLRIGLPRSIQPRMADVKWVGEPAKDEEYQKLGVTPPRANSVRSPKTRCSR